MSDKRNQHWLTTPAFGKILVRFNCGHVVANYGHSGKCLSHGNTVLRLGHLHQRALYNDLMTSPQVTKHDHRNLM